MGIRDINLEDYRYDLPVSRIAGHPPVLRDAGRLLHFRQGNISDTLFSGLPDLLPEGSRLVLNDTRVIAARLLFKKPTGALIEIFLLEPVDPAEYSTAFQTQGSSVWKAAIGNQKKWKEGALTDERETPAGKVTLTAEYAAETGNLIRLGWTPGNLPFASVLEFFGKTPIPPYLHREAAEEDKLRYQTVYAHYEGSVAAPTAGLHFTEPLIDRIKSKGITFNYLTLHVGAGTFVPVKSATLGDHRMHEEKVIISRKTISDLIHSEASDVTAVGTTSLRSLESLYWIGCKIQRNPSAGPAELVLDQWYPYESRAELPKDAALGAVLELLEKFGQEQIEFQTGLMIVPGYRFRMARRLITNFHQPGSTLLLLVSACIGDHWKAVYRYALDNGFRFLSYGDGSLLEIQD